MERKILDTIEVSRGGFLNPAYVVREKEKAIKILGSRWENAEIVGEESEKKFIIKALAPERVVKDEEER